MSMTVQSYSIPTGWMHEYTLINGEKKYTIHFKRCCEVIVSEEEFKALIKIATKLN